MKKKEVNKTKININKTAWNKLVGNFICDNCEKELENLIKLRNGLFVCERCYDIYYQEYHKDNYVKSNVSIKEELFSKKTERRKKLKNGISRN